MTEKESKDEKKSKAGKLRGALKRVSKKEEKPVKEKKDKKKKFYRKEFRSQSFTRRVDLPVQVKSDQAEAEFENGVLTLTLPKAEEAKPKTVTVKAKKVKK